MELSRKNELVKKQWIDDLVARRTEVESLVSQALVMLERASAITPGVTGLCSVLSEVKWLSLVNRHGGPTLPNRVTKAAMKRFDQEGWRELITHSEITNYLNADQKRNMLEQANAAPALTEENIKATFFNLWDTREDTWEEGVIDVFRHAAKSAYKSQGRFCIGTRILLANPRGRVAAYGFSSEIKDQLTDIVRICRLLSNRGHDVDDHVYVDEIEKAIEVGEPFDTAYGRLRFYQNGNLHYYLLPEYIETINEIIARRMGRALSKDRRNSTSANLS